MNNELAHLAATAKRFSDADSAARWSDLYDSDTQRLDDVNFRRRRDLAVQIALELLPPNGWVLDVGCGAAPVLSELRRRGAACIGLEYAPDMLAHARQRLRALGLEERDLFQGDCRTMPFASESFDVVVCLGVISYVENYVDVLREIRRVLRPGGYALISFRNRFNPLLWDPIRLAKRAAAVALRRTRPETFSIGRFMDHREFQSLMKQQGFELRAQHGIGFGPIRLNGRPLLAERAAIRFSAAATKLLRAHGTSSRWLADVSLWVYRK